MPVQNDEKSRKMTETLAYGYSFESTRQELSNEYQHDGLGGYQKSFGPFAFEESSLSSGRVKKDGAKQCCFFGLLQE